MAGEFMSRPGGQVSLVQFSTIRHLLRSVDCFHPDLAGIGSINTSCGTKTDQGPEWHPAWKANQTWHGGSRLSVYFQGGQRVRCAELGRDAGPTLVARHTHPVGSATGTGRLVQ